MPIGEARMSRERLKGRRDHLQKSCASDFKASKAEHLTTPYILVQHRSAVCCIRHRISELSEPNTLTLVALELPLFITTLSISKHCSGLEITRFEPSTMAFEFAQLPPILTTSANGLNLDVAHAWMVRYCPHYNDDAVCIFFTFRLHLQSGSTVDLDLDYILIGL